MDRSVAADGQVSALKDPLADLQSAVTQLGQALVTTAPSRASDQVGEWTDRLISTAKASGPAEGAALAAASATLAGKNPVWAMAKGAWAGANAKQKTLIILVAILAVVLLPVGLLVLLLGLGYLGVRSALK